MRGRANALLDAGSKLGPGLGTLLGDCYWRAIASDGFLSFWVSPVFSGCCLATMDAAHVGISR